MSTSSAQSYTAPKDHRLLFENERVRVLEILVPPGEATGMHDHPSYVAYNITAARVRFTFADGSQRDVDVKQGDTVWSEALSHDFHNVGDTVSHGVIVELKQ
jgi:quercetin dioxygenase-like cupin family protein